SVSMNTEARASGMPKPRRRSQNSATIAVSASPANPAAAIQLTISANWASFIRGLLRVTQAAPCCYRARMKQSVNEEGIASAAAALIRGELIAFPTETVYGLAADATNDRAVAKVYEAKGRPS